MHRSRKGSISLGIESALLKKTLNFHAGFSIKIALFKFLKNVNLVLTERCPQRMSQLTSWMLGRLTLGQIWWTLLWITILSAETLTDWYSTLLTFITHLTGFTSTFIHFSRSQTLNPSSSRTNSLRFLRSQSSSSWQISKTTRTRSVILRSTALQRTNQLRSQSLF